MADLEVTILTLQQVFGHVSTRGVVGDRSFRRPSCRTVSKVGVCQQVADVCARGIAVLYGIAEQLLDVTDFAVHVVAVQVAILQDVERGTIGVSVAWLHFLSQIVDQHVALFTIEEVAVLVHVSLHFLQSLLILLVGSLSIADGIAQALQFLIACQKF